MGGCLSCILGDSEEASSPNSFTSSSNLKNSKSASNSGNKFLNSSSMLGPGGTKPKAKMKSDRIDALIEKQASEQYNIVKILLLGKHIELLRYSDINLLIILIF